VVKAARGRELGVGLKQTAEDFGTSEASLSGWQMAVDVEAGVQPGITTEQAAELRELRRRHRLLERRRASLPVRGSSALPAAICRRSLLPFAAMNAQGLGPRFRRPGA
jgi:transposase